MSWIAGLADKAENILNKIDQNAATALQIPADGAATVIGETVGAMRKSLSSSTLSLKASLSPAKTKSADQRGGGGAAAGASSSSSLKNETMTDSMKGKGRREAAIDWSINNEMSSSRRSSVDSKADAVVSIDMGGLSTPPQRQNSTSSLQMLTSKSAASESRELAALMQQDMENASLKQRSLELELLVRRLTEERDQVQGELNAAQLASNAYVHSLSELESNLGKMQQEYHEMAQKLQLQLRETEMQRQELNAYRAKAQRALQTKDSLIVELKAKTMGASGEIAVGVGVPESDMRVLQMEYDALKQEQKHTLDENQKLLMQLEESRRDSVVFGKQHAEQIASLRTGEEALRAELRLVREHALADESEQRLLGQELDSLRQQLAAAATRLQEKEQQLQQLRAKVCGPSGGIEGEDSAEFDRRLQTLTLTLVDKQAALERVTAERNALRLQLEKAHDRLQQSGYKGSTSLHIAPRNSILSNSTDDVKAQFPLLMREHPFDTRVARRVKRAYSKLDSAGIRLGAFLRRYPLMRIFVLMYVALLHIWVMFVLLSSTPPPN